VVGLTVKAFATGIAVKAQGSVVGSRAVLRERPVVGTIAVVLLRRSAVAGLA
jgi:hypothetical protein